MTKNNFSPFLHFIFTKLTQIHGKLTYINHFLTVWAVNQRPNEYLRKYTVSL